MVRLMVADVQVYATLSRNMGNMLISSSMSHTIIVYHITFPMASYILLHTAQLLMKPLPSTMGFHCDI